MTSSPLPSHVPSSPDVIDARLLVVDDEQNIRDLLSETFRLVGFDVAVAASGVEALNAVLSAPPDLVVLDVMLPDMDGYEVARMLRHDGREVPVLFLTARDTVRDRVEGLSVGGDDYVTKPFSLEEVVLRVRAILRRTRRNEPAADPVLRCAGLELDAGAHTVRRDGRELELSPTEFRMLAYLLENSGRVVSKAQILERVWGYDFGGDTRIVESYVYYLRKKIDSAGAAPLIHTLRGVGYVLRAPK